MSVQHGLDEVLAISPVIPVLVIDNIEDALPLARALSAGGLKVLEVTLRTEAALQAITELRAACPELIIGAGTILNSEHYRQAVAAGSQFIVSPGVCEEVLQEAEKHDVPLLPGASTLSEMMALLARGYQTLKFFPAELNGGAKFLKTVGAVIPQLRFCPTGGISPSNAGDYLQLDNVACIGGSWMASGALVAEKQWQKISADSAAAVALKN
ncbi:2-keto-3-deoxy-phosphogluconate aldolase [Sinobacterium caligoides]|uniref:2-dehydro-3-deoxy-phosphogluconate aldolase n=1 Tax=Sinobacterium caligoides TaxID=933926 RepID=A0A3N2DNP0_9GAMM|nr:bifunctional 4-hydroxy-2-oxoglutarate aldolase/2-dehydro-3-deoxy-phosphogluconate aldolase [Sinobacterium caligoides]ROS01417.1 2-keto-3-deoxy-phosphogluconate aldolase [Sinobacterium caligoides]